jgi:hypothetical protein
LDSDTQISKLQDSIVKMGALSFSTQFAVEPTALGNKLVSDTIRQQRQAERNFLTAVLRKESGASISPSEFADGAKNYFPRPGDDAVTLANKAKARQTQIQTLTQSVPQAAAQKAANQNKSGGDLSDLNFKF